jgi:hypothetical protein
VLHSGPDQRVDTLLSNMQLSLLVVDHFVHYLTHFQSHYHHSTVPYTEVTSQVVSVRLWNCSELLRRRTHSTWTY